MGAPGRIPEPLRRKGDGSCGGMMGTRSCFPPRHCLRSCGWFGTCRVPIPDRIVGTAPGFFSMAAKRKMSAQELGGGGGERQTRSVPLLFSSAFPRRRWTPKPSRPNSPRSPTPSPTGAKRSTPSAPPPRPPPNSSAANPPSTSPPPATSSPEAAPGGRTDGRRGATKRRDDEGGRRNRLHSIALDCTRRQSEQCSGRPFPPACARRAAFCACGGEG